MAKKITFLKGNLCILKFFIDVLYIFLFDAKEKLQFDMDFVLITLRAVVSPGRTLRPAWRTTAHRVVLNLPCAQPIVLGCRIHDPGSVMRTGLKDKVLDFE